MTQEQYDGLIEVIKAIIKPKSYSLPPMGKRAGNIIDAVSIFNPRELFLIDVHRAGNINKEKYKLQLRYRRDILLVRLDHTTAPHANPDGEVIQKPHLHIVSEQYGMSYAIELPVVFTDASNFIQTLKEFLAYCNVNNIEDLSLVEQQGLIE